MLHKQTGRCRNFGTRLESKGEQVRKDLFAECGGRVTAKEKKTAGVHGWSGEIRCPTSVEVMVDGKR